LSAPFNKTLTQSMADMLHAYFSLFPQDDTHAHEQDFG